MNKLILSFFLIFSIQISYSQEDIITESTPLYEQIQSALADLDLSEITSNVFYEKGMSYYNWKLLNGDLLHDSLALGAEHWNWAYSQAASSHIQDDDNFPEPTHFKELKRNWTEGPNIPIASLHFQYHRFREDAIDLNLISFDNNNKTFHDVPFRPFSPYIEDEFFIATPLIKTVEGTEQTFILEEELQISNLDSPTQQLLASLDTFHNQKLTAELEEFSTTTKGNWMTYIPSLGVGYAPNGQPRPTVSYSLSQVFSAKKQKERQEAKKRSLVKNSEIQRQSDKNNLTQLINNYNQIVNDLDIKKQLFDIDEEIFLFYKKKYEALEMKPSEFLLKKRDYISKKYEISKLETQIVFAENEILLKAHYNLQN